MTCLGYAADEEYHLDFSNLAATYLGVRDHDDRKERILDLLERMKAAAPNWSDLEIAASPEAADTAKRLVRNLLSNRELPKVAAEADGDVILVWEDCCVVTVQNQLLHMVERPGTPHAEYEDDVSFVGKHIPPSILRAIPMK
jgi:hypothetical protein